MIRIFFETNNCNPSDYEIEDDVNRIVNIYNKVNNYIKMEDRTNYDIEVSNALYFDFIRIAIMDGKISHKEVEVYENDIKYIFDKNANSGVIDGSTGYIDTKYPKITDIQFNAQLRLAGWTE